MIVSLCVNDPVNGDATGRVSAVHVEDDGDLIELEGDFFDDDANPRCEMNEVSGCVTIAGVAFPIHGYKAWYGNWCWDGVEMERGDVKRLITLLIAEGFTVTAAPLATTLLPPPQPR